MASCNHANAIGNINQANEYMMQLRALVLPSANNCSGIARDLFEGALGSIAAALSELQPIASGHDHPGTKRKAFLQNKKITDESSKNNIRKRSKGSQCWTIVTAVPHDDGHQWRKYGQKKIRGETFLRHYYRCTYSDQGCSARKTIQQKDDISEDPPKFVVSHVMHHTCKPLQTSLVPFTSESSLTNSASSVESKTVLCHRCPDNPSSENKLITGFSGSSSPELRDATVDADNWDFDQWLEDESISFLVNQFITLDGDPLLSLQ